MKTYQLTNNDGFNGGTIHQCLAMQNES